MSTAALTVIDAYDLFYCTALTLINTDARFAYSREWHLGQLEALFHPTNQEHRQ